MDTNKTPVEEIREIRHRIAAECGNDIRRIMAHATAAVRELGLRTVPAVS